MRREGWGLGHCHLGVPFCGPLLKAGRIEIHPKTGNIMGIWWDMRIRISSNLSFFMDDLPIKSNETLHDGNAIIWVCYKKGYRRCSGKQPFLYCDMNFIAKWQHNRIAVSNLCNHTIYMYLWEETPKTSLAQPVSSPIHRQPWLQRLTSEHRLFAEEGSGSASTARDEFLLAVDAPIFYPPPANMGRRKATKLDKELIIISNMRNNIVSKQHKKPRRNT